MKHNAIVIKTDGDKATVSVLREEACSHCAGRVVCGTAKKFDVTVKNPVSAVVGDTVVIENSSGNVIAYSALVFLAPVALALICYLIFSHISAALSYAMTALGFVLPFVIAFVIDQKNRDKRLPVITEILAPGNDAPPTECGD